MDYSGKLVGNRHNWPTPPAQQQVTGTVNVGNWPNDERVPFQTTLQGALEVNVSNLTILAPVPPGSRLLVEQVSITVNLPPGQVALAKLLMTGEPAGEVAIPLQNQGTFDWGTTYVGTEHVTLFGVYASESNPGPRFFVTRSAAAYRSTVTASVIGYLVPELRIRDFDRSGAFGPRSSSQRHGGEVVARLTHFRERRRHMTKASMRGVLAALSPERNLSGAIYGTITAGALLAVESSYRQTLAQAASALATTLVIYWFAHTYASLLEARLRTPKRWTPRDFIAGLLHEWPIVQGAFIPLIVLVAVGAAGASVRTAEHAALASSAVLLLLLEVLAGQRARLGRAETAADVAVGIVLALGLIAVKAVLK